MHGPTILALISFDWPLFIDRLVNPGAVYWNGLAITILVAVIAQCLGIVFGGIIVSLSRSWWLLRIIARAYVLVFRGTPIIVQIFFVYFGANLFLGFTLFPRDVNLAGIHLQGAILAGTTALALNEAAYMSEIIRSGLDAIDTGQMEAAQCVGMTRRAAMRHIILPQASRIIVPPLGNQFNLMLKVTSLLSFIGVTEIFGDAQETYANDFHPVEVLAAVAVWYLILTVLWTVVQHQIEKRLGVSDLDARGSRQNRRLGNIGP